MTEMHYLQESESLEVLLYFSTQLSAFSYKLLGLKYVKHNVPCCLYVCVCVCVKLRIMKYLF
jgi:hypothetical protein